MQPFQSQCIHPLTATKDSFLALHVHPASLTQSARNDQHHCTICWNQYGKTEFDDEKPEQPVQIDPCGHVFGQLCLQRHFLCNLQEAKCPTCRCDLYGVPIEIRRQEIERRNSERAPQEILERRSRPGLSRYFSRSERRRRTTVTVQPHTDPPNPQPMRTEAADLPTRRTEPAGPPPPYTWTDDLNYRLTMLLQSGAVRPPDQVVQQPWPGQAPGHNMAAVHTTTIRNRRSTSLGNGSEMTDEEWMRRLMLFSNEIA